MAEFSGGCRFEVFTLFPPLLNGFLGESILKKAIDRGLVAINLHNIRDYAADRHRTCDATPYGGGGGMVLKPEPVYAAVEHVLGGDAGAAGEDVPVVLLSPQGRLLTQAVVEDLSSHRRLALICGRYEGFDERIRTGLATDEISIGDYVLNGGEVAAMVVIEAVSRLIPGVLGFDDSNRNDSHSVGMSGWLEGPHYTRPAVFRGQSIPPVLTSGNHAEVDRWRHEQSLLRTAARRPDLLRKYPPDEKDAVFLTGHGYDLQGLDIKTKDCADD